MTDSTSASQAPENALHEIQSLLRAGDLDRVEEVWMEILERESEPAPPLAEGLLEVAAELLAKGLTSRAGPLLELLWPQIEGAGTLAPDLKLRALEYLVRALPEKKEYRRRYAALFEEIYGPTTPERAFFAAVRLLEAEDPRAALDRLKKLLQFRPGTVVHHPAGWGLGEVLSVDPFLKQVVVDLEEKKGHRISIDAVDSILEPLDPESFRALLHRDPERLERLAEEDPVALVDKVLDAFGNPLPVKEIRARLVPAVVPARGWTRWWTKTKELLQHGGRHRVSDRAPHRVERRESAVDYEEELASRVRSGPWEDARQAARTVLRGGPSKFARAWPEVVAALRERAVSGSEIVAALESACLLEKAGRTGEESVVGDTVGRWAAAEVLEAASNLAGAEDRRRVLEALGSRPEGLDLLTRAVAEGTDSLRTSAWEVLSAVAPEAAREFATEILRTPTRSPAAFLWLLDRKLGKRAEGVLDVFEARSPRDLLVAAFDTLEYALSGRRGATAGERRDLLKRFEAILLDPGGFFERALSEAAPGERTRIRERVARLADQLPQAAPRLLDLLTQKFQAEGAQGALEPWADENVIYVTAEGLARRKEEFRVLMEEKLPENFEAVGRAADFGDLSENAEFTSALEEQGHLTRKAAELKEELDRARLLTPDLVPPDKVGLGSRLRVEDLESGETREFSLLGPWDGTIEEGVLSYRSPLGRAFLGAKAGETVEARLPGGVKRFRILTVGSHFEATRGGGAVEPVE